MIKDSISREWQRYHAIHHAAFEFYDLQLRYPASAQRLTEGSLHQSPESTYQFRNGDSFSDVFDGIFSGPGLAPEQTQENEDWHRHVRAVIACLSKIYAAGFICDPKTPLDAELENVADRALGTIVGQVWRSLARVSHHHYNDNVFQKVDELVRQNQEFERSISVETESTNA